MAELFRFMLARPAAIVPDVITVGPQFEGETISQISQALSAVNPSRLLDLKFGSNISKLDGSLPSDLSQTKKVEDAVQKAFPDDSLPTLVQQEGWTGDETNIDTTLIASFLSGSDTDGNIEMLSRWRQLYDLVAQVAEHSSTDQASAFRLKPLALPLTTSGVTGPGQSSQISAPQSLPADNSQKITDLSHILGVLNSAAIFPRIDSTSSVGVNVSVFALQPSWTSLLSSAEQDLVQQNFNKMSDLRQLQQAVVTSLQQEINIARTAPIMPGLFTLAGENIELTKAPVLPSVLAENVDNGSIIPDAVPSPIRPSGVGDLLVVRDHVVRYEGGEIGNIQNVLKSEKMVRQTKRLDKTEQVNVISQSTEDDEERDSSTTEKFSLAQEASNVIKDDSSFKAGLSISGKYGPTVSFKADASTAQNSSKETATKVASQYSKDVTSRAASKVIQKTFSSSTVTTISQFTEDFRHEFDNTKPGDTNIAGIYQWVNKVSQSQMFNYGQRLLFDVVVPEPAAFLLTAVNDAEPVVVQPVALTESAADLNEANYASIAARYQTPGIKAPPLFQLALGQAFNLDANQVHAGSWSSNIAIPTNYLAYSAAFGYAEFHQDITGESTFPSPEYTVGGQSGQSAIFDPPFLSGSIGVSITTHNIYTFSGSVRVNCVRSPESYTNWQHQTYDAIAQAYTVQKSAYDRTVAEASVANATINPVSGNNPDENTKLIRNELKKACITLLTSQSFNVFNGLQTDNINSIVEVNPGTALLQGPYIEFFEQAFEWEELQYALYPYFWSRKSTWKTRLLIPSADPDFADFIKAGAARVSFAARLGFTPDVLYFLQMGKPWQGGAVPPIHGPDYLPIAQEIADAENRPGQEVPQGDPWEVSVPTELVKLRDEEGNWTWEKNGPLWKMNATTNEWVEKR